MRKVRNHRVVFLAARFFVALLMVFGSAALASAQFSKKPAATVDIESGIKNNSFDFLEFSPDSKTLVVGDWHGNIYTIDVEKKKKAAEWKPNAEKFMSVRDISFGKRTVMIGWSNCAVATFKFSSTQIKLARKMMEPKKVTDEFVTFSDDGKKIAMSYSQVKNSEVRNVIDVFDLGKKSKIGTLQYRERGGPIRFCRDGMGLVCRVMDKNILLVDLKKMDADQHKSIPASMDYDGISLSHDQKKVYVFSEVDSAYIYFDIESQKAKSFNLFRENSLSPLAIAFSPHIECFAIVGEDADSQIRIGDASSGELKHKLTSTAGRKLLSAAFSPDGKWLAVGAAVSDKIELWDVSTLAKQFKAVSTKPNGNPDKSKTKIAVKGKSKDKKKTASKSPKARPKKYSLRTWTSAQGNFSIKATFVSTDQQKVRLKRTDGSVIEVELAKLSQRDRDYVRNNKQPNHR